MAGKHADLGAQAQPQVGQGAPEKARRQADGACPQRDQRIDGVAGKGAADHIGHCTHGKALHRPEQHSGQQGGQAAQVEPDKAGGNAQHPGKHDAHGSEQGQHGELADGISGMVHINCPPLFREPRGGQCKTPSPVTNRTKEGVIQRFTSRRGRRRPHLHPSPCSSGMQAMHRGSYLRPQHNSPLMRHLTRMALLC